MKNTVKIENQELVINENSHMHVNSVIVFTGDDDYNVTESMMVKSIQNDYGEYELIHTTPKKPTRNIKTTRIRGEVGIIIELIPEGSEENQREWMNLVISHHKGTQQIRLYNYGE